MERALVHQLRFYRPVYVTNESGLVAQSANLVIEFGARYLGIRSPIGQRILRGPHVQSYMH